MGELYIAPQSSGYFETVDGRGFISDGLKSWGLFQDVNEDFYLAIIEDFASPAAFNAPKLGTGILSIGDAVSDAVSDHNDGFAPAGGGGADLPIDASFYPAPEIAGTQTGLWAKVSGTRSTARTS